MLMFPPLGTIFMDVVVRKLDLFHHKEAIISHGLYQFFGAHMVNYLLIKSSTLTLVLPSFFINAAALNPIIVARQRMYKG